MVVHRDYRLSSDSIVKVYDHKIEFYNPGHLPGSISIDDLLTNNYKSTPRNKLIADFCKCIGLIEKYGSGIRRIIDYFVADNLPVPEFRNISDGFMVTVFDNVTDNVTDKIGDDRLIAILGLIRQNNQISAKQLSIHLSVSDRTIKRDLEKLKTQGKIIRHGNEKGGYWEISNKKV